MPISNAARLRVLPSAQKAQGLQCLCRILELPENPAKITTGLPFSTGDATAGMENEWQAAVRGGSDTVDLPRAIKASSYYGNLVKKAASGDTSPAKVSDLYAFLSNNAEGVWENSWVRLPVSSLNEGARQVLDTDLLANKCDPGCGQRRDVERFYCRMEGEKALRIPISYLLKLALADVSTAADAPAMVTETGRSLLDHFLNDNTSPEVTSFSPVALSPDTGMGQALVRESSRRFILSQLLLQYANRKFGLNLTYYGLLNANAYLLASIVALVLLGAMGVGLGVSAMMLAAVLGICMPAAKITARIVEKKRYTFSVGGASFVGIVVIPWVAMAVGWVSGQGVDPLGVMAVVAIAYTFGEGAGRLACISFGCCYGRPVASLPRALQRIFARFHFIFHGETKKCAYASRLDGTPVVPVQAITAVLYCGTGVLSLSLMLYGHTVAALILSLVVTQLWRFFSEFLRSDYRGDGRISAYQIMGLAAIVYGLVVSFFFPSTATTSPPDIVAGLKQLWAPAPILMLQLLWVGAFLYTGRSQVTGASIRFFVHLDRI